MKTSRLFCLAVSVCVILSGIFMATAAKAAPSSASGEFEKIDEFVRLKMQALHIPGLSLGIVKGDQILYMKGYGEADGQGRAVEAQTPFLIGSTSKAFTATAVMQLAGQGKIRLDDPVQTYLPWFTLADREASRTITIRNLLSHTSGLSSFDSAKYNMLDNMDLEQFVRNLRDAAINRPVGSSFEYCNANYGILGEVIHAVSGMPYETYIQKHILDPLEMKNSYTSHAEAKKGGLAVGHNSFFGFILPTSQPPHTGSIPSGYLVSSAEDMCHFLIAHMNDGRYRDKAIFSADAAGQMHEPSAAAAKNYGMGWMILPDMIYHNGDNENYHTHMRIMNDGGYGIVTLMNVFDSLMPVALGQDVYESVPDGIVAILSGQQAEVNPGRNLDNFYLIVSIITVASVAVFIWRLVRLRSWHRRLQSNKLKVKATITGLLLLNVLLPAALLMLFPNFFNAPWIAILAFGPGFGHFLLFLPVSLFVIGAVKFALLLAKAVRRKSPVAGELCQ